MKKIILGLLVFVAVFSLASCGKNEATATPTGDEPSNITTPTQDEIKTMTYSEFMAAESGDDVRIEGYIAAKQSFWNNAAVVYLVGGIGEGYLIYNMPMTEEEYNSLYTIGTCINVKGTKAIYALEHEIDGAKGVDVTVKNDAKEFQKEAIDLTESVDSDAIFKYQNAYFKATLKVKEYTTTSSDTGVSANKAYGYKGDEPTDDLYICFEDEKGNVLNACIEAYLTNKTTDVYDYVLNHLEVGQLVTIEGYLYWWNGANPHITSITQPPYVSTLY